MQTFTRFKVAGANDFPLDMLRFDRCYPESERATHTMTYPLDEQRTVELCQTHDAAEAPHITKDRWASYGWPVVDIVTAEFKRAS